MTGTVRIQSFPRASAKSEDEMLTMTEAVPVMLGRIDDGRDADNDGDDDECDDVAATDASALIITENSHSWTYVQTHTHSCAHEACSLGTRTLANLYTQRHTHTHRHTLSQLVIMQKPCGAERNANNTSEPFKVYSMTDRTGDAAATGPPQKCLI